MSPLCVTCKHFQFDGGEPDYSEYTPGEQASLSCNLDLMGRNGKVYTHYLTLMDFRNLIRSASKCPKYEEASDFSTSTKENEK